ncbi:uncharacterized protein MONOS_3024 [Monocercomonoides exilis]|uniref:uncharacterized protein n=1 Tax=Monocercomonoides exilis TaxID=2049356 RepID=UPI003559C54D|nr:hypothetical protein MONOS_3024 [Monocercomonoides exilis]|eukprot:MONOS_3024.1-p1 / transcript=MONOS_3024.1 / gene=MONOS_3024 / organism=Monocercomonoides_exilis_PA203 / gene_product=unspecified product / transcript_product=unspecified product / location=Mono_scaffold00067:45652-46434(-) / protein_length=261 / sequence_SO=supercontig / SO=protein_coding / is_pseudo=false
MIGSMSKRQSNKKLKHLYGLILQSKKGDLFQYIAQLPISSVQDVCFGLDFSTLQKLAMILISGLQDLLDEEPAFDKKTIATASDTSESSQQEQQKVGRVGLLCTWLRLIFTLHGERILQSSSEQDMKILTSTWIRQSLSKDTILMKRLLATKGRFDLLMAMLPPKEPDFSVANDIHKDNMKSSEISNRRAHVVSQPSISEATLPSKFVSEKELTTSAKDENSKDHEKSSKESGETTPPETLLDDSEEMWSSKKQKRKFKA